MSISFYRSYGKRLCDLAVAIPAIILLLPVLALTALLVRIFLGSPVIFWQERPGIGGRIFRIFKFRTMTDARDANGQLLDDEHRLTTFGKFLRASSLDELPELWNVVVGKMSLIGPRPLKVQYLPLYSLEQGRRHDVLPGITGWAQVNGRNALAWEDRFQLDVWYVDNLSFWLDLKILWKTVAAVVSRKGIAAQGHVSMPEFEGTKKVIVIGAGGHGKVVVSTLQAAGIVVDLVYDDDQNLWGTKVLGVPVCGPVAKLQSGTRKVEGIVGIGDASIRQKLVESLTIDWLTAIHPLAFVHPSAKLGCGTVIFAGAILQPDVTIGMHSVVNTSASVDHDCSIGDYVNIGPGTHLSGAVRIDDRSQLGTGSCVLPMVHIHSDVIVGAGTVVIRDLPSDCTVIGPTPRIIRYAEDEYVLKTA